MLNNKEIGFEAFCDGGSRGNPGPSACGVVIKKSGEIIDKKGKFLGEDTNNVAEWMGLVTSLEIAIEKNYFPLKVYMDSLLVVSQINGKWKLKAENLRPYFIKSRDLMKGKQIEVFHVLRDKNKDADKVVNETLDQELGV
jgi:ribonuclease HI